MHKSAAGRCFTATKQGVNYVLHQTNLLFEKALESSAFFDAIEMLNIFYIIT